MAGSAGGARERQPEGVLAEGLCFGEGPRWHEGELFLSDMHAHEVIALSPSGARRRVCEVPEWPSGLGWLPDGRLLVVSMRDRRLLRLEPEGLALHADLGELASFHLNDMVVDAEGRAYVGNFGFDLHGGGEFRKAELVAVEPDGSARIAARELAFPNGAVIAPGGATLLVAETYARRLTAFDRGAGGALSGRREWAKLPEGAVPDGICLDAEGGVWCASPTSSECLRVEEGGRVTDRVAFSQGAFACMLGGAERRTLYVLTAPASDPDEARRARGGRVEWLRVDVPGAGRP